MKRKKELMTIIIEHVSKIYQEHTIALHDIHLQIESGMFGLLGPNGAGKTTLLRIMASILPISSGRVVVDGYDLSRTQEKKQARQYLGYLPQEFDLYPDLSGEEFLDYFGLLKGITARGERHTQVTKLLEVLNLTDVSHQKIKTYSGGMKRRLGIGQALLGNPHVIIVDEPTAGLDPEERIRIRRVLSELAHDRIVVLSTHVIEDIAQTCERLAILHKGKLLFQGPTREIITLARGYTWEVISDETQVFPSKVQVVASVPSGENILYRVVGELDLHLQSLATPVAPTLEDGYVRLQQNFS